MKRILSLLSLGLWCTVTQAADPFSPDVNTGFFGGTTAVQIQGTFTTPPSGLTNPAVAIFALFGDGAATGAVISDVSIVETSGGTPVSADHVVTAGTPGTTTHDVALYVSTRSLAPSTQYTVTIDLTAANEIWGYARLLHTVDQTVPVRDSDAIREASLAPAAPISNTLSSAVGDYVLGGLITNGTTLFTVTGDQTDVLTSTTSDARQMSSVAGAASISVAYSNSTVASLQAALASASFQSPTGGGTPSIPMIYRHQRQMKQ